METRYYGRFNGDGPYIGFYTSDIWDEKDFPIEECIELTYDEWKEGLTGRSKVIDGKHVYSPITQQELDALAMQTVRAVRDKLLLESDWTQMATDAQLSDSKKEEWATYRQSLRDLPSTVDINNIIYPTKPQ